MMSRLLRLAAYRFRLFWAEHDVANFRADIKYHERHVAGARVQLKLAEQRASLARQARTEVEYPLARRDRVFWTWGRGGR